MDRFIDVNDGTCQSSMTTESKNFTIKSTGVVGDVSRSYVLVMRVHGASEELYHFHIE